ncbi:hypothetical protein JOL62DRAFT_558953 [Phyllosticta paracitricarpa]|uniref:Uncharacterized protein n=1 Tax=Phyllosticta paracitricarpa TaxID=2016321 RepID=A0ABR1N0I2_9PEZI
MYRTHDAHAVAVRQTALVMYQETYHHRPARIIYAPQSHPEAGAALEILLFEVSRDLEAYLRAFVEGARRSCPVVRLPSADIFVVTTRTSTRPPISPIHLTFTPSSSTQQPTLFPTHLKPTTMIRMDGDRNWWTHRANSSSQHLERFEDMTLVYADLNRQMHRPLTHTALGDVVIDVRVWQNPDFYADFPAFVDLFIGLGLSTNDDDNDAAAFQTVDIRGCYHQTYRRSGELMFAISYHIYGVVYGALPTNAAAYVLLPVELDGEILRPCCVCDRWVDGVLDRTTWGQAAAVRRFA